MRCLVRLPFSVYLGWITVATVANVTDVLSFHKWSGFGISGEVWAMIMLGVAVVLALLMTIVNRDAAYLAVLIWAFVGIGAKFANISIVSTAGYVAAGLVGIMFLTSLFSKPKRELV